MLRPGPTNLAFRARACFLPLSLVFPLLLGCGDGSTNHAAAAPASAAGKGVAPSGDDWPQFRGPTGQGVVNGPLPITWSPTKNIVWKAQLPGPGASTPILFGDRVYVTCYSGFNEPGKPGDMSDLERHLVALDRKTGAIVWSKSVPAKLPEQANIREEHGYASNTPCVDADAIYCFWGKSGVQAFDHDGNSLWTADVGSGLHGWGSAASPILAGDLVIVNASVESGSMYGLNKKTGKQVWKAGRINEAWNTPVLVQAESGRTELVVGVLGKVLAFDPATGNPLWSCNNDITWYIVPCIVANEGVVYSLGGRSGVAAVAVRTGGSGDVTSTRRLWKGNKGSNVTSPVYHDGHLYWMNDNQGIAYCAEAATGRIVYEQRVARAGQVYASPLLADGKIYYVTRDGTTIVVPAKPQFEILAQNRLVERTVFNSSPSAAAGRLYLRYDSELYCIGEQ